MKHKTWFRLVLKAVGVLLAGFAIPDVFNALVSFIEYGASNSWRAPYVAASPVSLNDPMETFRMGLYLLGPCLQLALGLYLFLGGRWLVDKVIPSNRPYCPDCGYDLSHANGDRCPECGVTLPAMKRGTEGQRDRGTEG